MTQTLSTLINQSHLVAQPWIMEHQNKKTEETYEN
ncbi:hypothetical protein BXY82_1607 [Gelidibacter sediminis]|uniref:Uncharacterized protein n=1 Tax=Gelidibacter sediminis TaxID=1608710 RepID=A0A4R7PZM0_9FLAO|nr:hypothetical protein BXY82_1607 [Gelidibacter sediminis]